MITAKKRAFIDYFARTRNTQLSARNAGYSRKNAYNQGSKLLKDTEVIQELDRMYKLELEHFEIGLPVYKRTAWERANNKDLKEETQFKYFENLGKVQGFFDDKPNINLGFFTQIASDAIKSGSIIEVSPVQVQSTSHNASLKSSPVVRSVQSKRAKVSPLAQGQSTSKRASRSVQLPPPPVAATPLTGRGD